MNLKIRRLLPAKWLSSRERHPVLEKLQRTGYYDWFEELSSDNLREHHEVNAIGRAGLTREVAPLMKAQRSGFILNLNKLFMWTIDLASSVCVRLKQAEELNNGQMEKPPP